MNKSKKFKAAQTIYNRNFEASSDIKSSLCEVFNDVLLTSHQDNDAAVDTEYWRLLFYK